MNRIRSWMILMVLLLLITPILSLVPQARVVEGDVFGSVGLGLALDAVRKFG